MPWVGGKSYGIRHLVFYFFLIVQVLLNISCSIWGGLVFGSEAFTSGAAVSSAARSVVMKGCCHPMAVCSCVQWVSGLQVFPKQPSVLSNSSYPCWQAEHRMVLKGDLFCHLRGEPAPRTEPLLCRGNMLCCSVPCARVSLYVAASPPAPAGAAWLLLINGVFCLWFEDFDVVINSLCWTGKITPAVSNSSTAISIFRSFSSPGKCLFLNARTQWQSWEQSLGFLASMPVLLSLRMLWREDLKIYYTVKLS